LFTDIDGFGDYYLGKTSALKIFIILFSSAPLQLALTGFEKKWLAQKPARIIQRVFFISIK